MASQEITEDFRGTDTSPFPDVYDDLTGTVSGPVVGVTLASFNWVEYNESFVSAPGSFRTQSSGTTLAPPTTGQARYARLEFSGGGAVLTHSAGVTVIEARVVAGVALEGSFDGGSAGAFSLDVTPSGAGTVGWDFVSINTFTVTAPGTAALVTLRVEVTSTQVRFYVDDVLKYTRGTGVGYGVPIDYAMLGMPGIFNAHGRTVGVRALALDALKIKTETVSGTILPPIAPPAPPPSYGDIQITEIYGYTDSISGGESYGSGTVFAPFSATVAVRDVSAVPGYPVWYLEEELYVGARNGSATFGRSLSASAATAKATERGTAIWAMTPSGRLTAGTFSYSKNLDDIAEWESLSAPGFTRYFKRRSLPSVEKEFITDYVTNTTDVSDVLSSARAQRALVEFTPLAQIATAPGVWDSADSAVTNSQLMMLRDAPAAFTRPFFVTRVVFVDLLTPAEIAAEDITLVGTVPGQSIDATLTAEEQNELAQEQVEDTLALEEARANPPSDYSRFWTNFNATYEVP